MSIMIEQWELVERDFVEDFSRPERVELWLDAMCDRFPWLMKEMVELGFGSLGSWLYPAEQEDNQGAIAVGGVCGCLIGTAVLAACKLDRVKVIDAVGKDRFSSEVEPNYDNAPEALHDFIVKWGNGNPMFSKKVISQVGYDAPKLAEYDGFAKDGYENTYEEDVKRYLSEYILARLGLIGAYDIPTLEALWKLTQKRYA
jgi:hypothetical protein